MLPPSMDSSDTDRQVTGAVSPVSKDRIRIGNQCCVGTLADVDVPLFAPKKIKIYAVDKLHSQEHKKTCKHCHKNNAKVFDFMLPLLTIGDV